MTSTKASNPSHCQRRHASRADLQAPWSAASSAAAADNEWEGEEESSSPTAAAVEGLLSPRTFLRMHPYPDHYPGLTPHHTPVGKGRKGLAGRESSGSESEYVPGGTQAEEEEEEWEADVMEGGAEDEADPRVEPDDDAEQDRCWLPGWQAGGGEGEDGSMGRRVGEQGYTATDCCCVLGGDRLEEYASDVSCKSGKWCAELYQKVCVVLGSRGRHVLWSCPRPPLLPARTPCSTAGPRLGRSPRKA